MAITKFIMGSLMGIYLMAIGSGHLTTKNVMAAWKGDGSGQQMQQDHNYKNHFDDRSD
jgi:hypothetical protein